VINVSRVLSSANSCQSKGFDDYCVPRKELTPNSTLNCQKNSNDLEDENDGILDFCNF
jgi:hypothetical protein